MALQSARHEAIHGKTGQALADMQAKFDDGFHSVVSDNPDNHPELAAVIYQIQKMQDELNYLRGIIDANNDKVGITTSQANAITANTAKTSFPGFGTSSSTALAGDTTTISTAQARDITSGALIDAKLNATKVQADLTKSTAITFGEFTTTVVGKTTTYSLPITVVETDTSGKSTVTTTKTGSITLV